MKFLLSASLLLATLSSTVLGHPVSYNSTQYGGVPFNTTTMIPDKAEVERMAASLSTNDTSPFFSRVSPNVTWDVLGTHPAAGHYTSLAEWKKNALGAIEQVLDKPLKLQLKNVIGGAPQDWAVIELEAHSECLNGMPYDQNYAWVMRFDESGTIVHVRAYLDSALVQKAIDENT